MVNRERFMLDVDSEGFPIVDTSPFNTINIGKTPDVQMAQSLLADVRCHRCPPTEMCSRSGTCDYRENPEGWREIDGVMLPTIAHWADMTGIVESAEQCALANMDGITRLSDYNAPDAYFGWKR